MIWHNELDIVKYSSNILEGLNLNQETFQFLIDYGLPEDSAPFLPFVANNRERYEGINPKTRRYDFLPLDFS